MRSSQLIKCPSAESMSENFYSQRQYRIVFMGAAKVGKTSIVSQFLHDKFDDRYTATVEDLYRGEYEVDGVDVTLDILDTSGAYQFPAMRKLSITTGDAFVLVFSVDDESSFEEVKKLRQQIIEEKGDANVPIVIVGNKSDITDNKRAVVRETTETIVTFDWGNTYVESSAKDNENVIQIFKEMLYQTDSHNNFSFKRRISTRYPMSINRRKSEPRNGKYNQNKKQACTIS